MRKQTKLLPNDANSMRHIPDDKGVPLWDADRVLVHEIIELGCNASEIEIFQAASHAVLPDLLQSWGYGGGIGAWCQKALHNSIYSLHMYVCVLRFAV